MQRGLSSIATLVLLASLAGCAASHGSSGSGPPPSPTGDATALARPTSTATLSILAPSTGEILPAGDIRLKVKLTGATVVAATSTVLVPDEGHLHVVLDDELISMTSGVTTTLPDVAAGRHLLKVEFVANDHAPFDPRVIAATSFTVKG